MYYEINISKLNLKVGAYGRYEHYFATAKRSITTKERLKAVHADLRKAFPEPRFNISITRHEERGEYVDMENL